MEGATNGSGVQMASELHLNSYDHNVHCDSDAWTEKQSYYWSAETNYLAGDERQRHTASTSAEVHF